MTRALALTFDNLGAAAVKQRGDEPPDPHPSLTVVLPFRLELLRELSLRATFCVEAVNTVQHPDAVHDGRRRPRDRAARLGARDLRRGGGVDGPRP